MPTNNKLKEYLEEELEKLPKELQEAINNFNWEKVIEEIGGNNKLSEEELLTLKVETALILVGLANPALYYSSVENNVGTTSDETTKIINEVTQRIFSPIYDILEENIKKEVKNKNLTWEQSLNFILSGGDYTAFVDQRRDIIN